MSRKWVAIWAIIAAAFAAALILVLPRARQWRPGLITLQGSVVRKDNDPRRETPLGGVTVIAFDGVTSASTISDPSGYFKLSFRERVWPSEQVTLSFRDSSYRPLDMKIVVGLRTNLRKLYVAELEPDVVPAPPKGPESVVSNIRIRYTANYESQSIVGTAVRTFQVVNQGNVPCQQHAPCSPDGVWKAAKSSVTMDAGPGNEFRNVRVSCFAGPCPFTRIDPNGFSQGGRVITASAIDWSDTATFLVEAEVFHDTMDSSVRESYPVIYGRVMHFTLPSYQEGVTIEAELNGSPMVFPLGPDLYTSWAACTSRRGTEGQNSIAFQCELKPGYRFAGGNDAENSKAPS